MRASLPEPVRFLMRSEDHLGVLATLAEGTSTRPALRAETGVERATLDRILDELGRRKLVVRVGSRYEVTPLGEFLAVRLRSVLDSVDVMQRLQRLPGQLPDAAAPEFDSGIPAGDAGEILAPTSLDPDAPPRRFVDLLQAASDVSLLVPALGPSTLDVCVGVDERPRTVELVVPRGALEATADEPVAARGLRCGIESGTVTLSTYDGDVPYLAGTVDDVAVLGLIDDTGTVRGYVETTDGTVRSWVEAAVEAHERRVERAGTGTPTD